MVSSVNKATLSGNRIKMLLVLCFVLMGINFIAYYPGFISSDGVDQYQQALTSVYGDWHPPAMAYLWHWFMYISKGLWTMLLLQCLCLWLAVFYLARLSVKLPWYLLVFIFPFLPFLQNFLGYIVKDSQMALCWLLAVSVLTHSLFYDRKLHLWELVLTALLIAYGTWIRSNALPGTVLLAYLWCIAAFKNISIKRNVLYTLLFLVVVLLCQKLIHIITSAKPDHPERKLFLHDMAGIYQQTSDNIYPDVLLQHPGFDTAYIRSKYHPATFDDIWWNADGKMIAAATEGQNDGLRRAWISAIRKHPVAYLSHRYESFLYYLRIKNRTNLNYYADFIVENPYGFAVRDNWLKRRLSQLFIDKERYWVMKPWFWLLYNTILLCTIPFVRSRRVRLATMVLAGSSFLYQIPMLFLSQVDTDFRYFYWTCISCSVATMLLIGYWRRCFPSTV